jgi:sulfide:quinone oxidoreductase
MKQIIVAGCGFAGLTTIKTLRRKGCRAPITLLAPRSEMFYYPSLIWVPAGLCTESDLRIPLDGFIRRYKVDYVAGSITGLDARGRRLRTTAGEMEYERLVIATGGRSRKQVSGLEHACVPCEGYDSVVAMTGRLAALEAGTLAFGFSGNPNEPTAIRGEMLFEFLFGIDTLLRRQKRRDRFDLAFFTPLSAPDARWGSASGTLMRELERRGIRSLVGHGLKGFDTGRVMTEGGDLKTNLIVFIPEVLGPAWVRHSDLPVSEDGFIRADAYCRVSGFEGSVYVAGDAGSFPGPDWVPKHGHMADLQAKALARNLIGDMNGTGAEHSFHQEYIYIVDSLDGGILVSRDLSRGRVRTFRSLALHWAKRLFIWSYLYQYRSL